MEAVIAVVDYLQSFGRNLRVRRIDKYTVTLRITSTYSSSYLMKSGQSESVGILNHHNSSIGYIDTNLNYGC